MMILHDAQKAITNHFASIAERVFSCELDGITGTVSYEPVMKDLEVWHTRAMGSAETLDAALREFLANAAFPFPSLKPRLTLVWRRMPQIQTERSFDRDAMIYRITARYALVLDMPDPRVKKRVSLSPPP